MPQSMGCRRKNDLMINSMGKVVDSAERQIFQVNIASYGNHMWDNPVWQQCG